MEHKQEHQEAGTRKEVEEQVPVSGESSPFNLFRMLNSNGDYVPIKPRMVMQLQRTIGNQATQGVLQRKKKPRRELLGTPAETIRELVMTRRQWQRRTTSTFNQRGANSPQLLDIDAALETLDAELASDTPDVGRVKKCFDAISAAIQEWKTSYVNNGGAQGYRQSARYGPMKELAEQMRQATPILLGWGANILEGGESGENFQNYMTTGDKGEATAKVRSVGEDSPSKQNEAPVIEGEGGGQDTGEDLSSEETETSATEEESENGSQNGEDSSSEQTDTSSTEEESESDEAEENQSGYQWRTPSFVRLEAMVAAMSRPGQMTVENVESLLAAIGSTTLELLDDYHQSYIPVREADANALFRVLTFLNSIDAESVRPLLRICSELIQIITGDESYSRDRQELIDELISGTLNLQTPLLDRLGSNEQGNNLTGSPSSAVASAFRVRELMRDINTNLQSVTRDRVETFIATLVFFMRQILIDNNYEDDPSLRQQDMQLVVSALTLLAQIDQQSVVSIQDFAEDAWLEMPAENTRLDNLNRGLQDRLKQLPDQILYLRGKVTPPSERQPTD